ncbi:MAG: metallophosphoesterase, partial [Anaerolineae bacterium]
GLRAFGIAAVIVAAAGLVSIVYNAGSTFGLAGLMAWSVFLHAPLFLIGSGLVALRSNAVLATVAWATAALIALVALDAFLIEPHWLEVSRITIPSAKIAEPLRIVVIADVQTDRPGDYEARVFDTAMAQAPDLILFAGDYIHTGRRSRGYEAEVAALNDLLVGSRMAAPLGIYAIAGNVDRGGDWTQVFAGLQATTVVETARYDLGPVVLTGLALDDAFDQNLRVEGANAFHIVLGHSPNFSLGSVDADLLIAGHTHGGQVRLPFIGPVMTLSAVPRSWAAGVTEIAQGKTLIVSRGIGMERGQAPRLRFLCRPELMVVDLVPE